MMINRQGRLKRRRAPSEGKLLERSLLLLILLSILLNVVFFTTVAQDHSTDAPSSNAFSVVRRKSSDVHRNITGVYSSSDQRILEIFRDAGVELSDEELRELPTWEQITRLVGDSPVIYNLENSCKRFRDAIPGVERNIGCSGMFNSGTNLVTQLLKENCLIPERVEAYGMEGPFHDKQGKPIGPGEAHGMRWQVPWGKHMPANFREEHSTKWATQIWKESVLAVVTIRHPYDWMKSLCKNHYTAYWPHNELGKCPNLINEKTNDLVPVEVKYDGNKQHYDSIAHLWNEWYAKYLERVDFPYLVVRFEDLQFHAKNVTMQICHCAGGVIRDDRPFQYIVHSAKQGPGHGKEKERTGMVGAWIKYSKEMPPRNGFSKLDYDASVRYLEEKYMTMFGYHHPPDGGNE